VLVKRVGKTKERGGKWEEMGCVTALVRDMIISSSIKRTVGGSSHEREKERERARARAREREKERERETRRERERAKWCCAIFDRNTNCDVRVFASSAMPLRVDISNQQFFFLRESDFCLFFFKPSFQHTHSCKYMCYAYIACG